MRRARVYDHGIFAGYLDELDNGSFRFTYDSDYVADESTESVSLTLPKRRAAYESDTLFAFFYGLASEGATRDLQANLLRIDRDDVFGLLLATGRDTIGSVTIEAE